MSQDYSIPEEYEIPFRRILPYLAAPLQKDPKVLESLVLYFKLGGDKMARIVIDALNVTHRIQYAEMIKKMREEAMLQENQNAEEGEGDEEDGDEADDKPDKEKDRR